MVERALLCKSIVDEATPPASGERWIADTKQRGFGLRLWASTGGGGKAFAIRAKDFEGRIVRRSINYSELYANSRERFWSRITGEPVSLGDLVADARNWARDELDAIKGRKPLWVEEAEQRQTAKDYAHSLSFERTAVLQLQAMAARGVSQSYRDRLDKLFVNHVPRTTRQKALLSVAEAEIRRLLNSKKLSLGNRRVLRPFLGQVLELAYTLHAVPKVSSYSIRRMRLRDEETAQLGEDTFAAVFERLEAEAEKWQQAMCLRLYFSFRAPLSRVMRAQWDELKDVRYNMRGSDSFFWRRSWFPKAHQTWGEEITIKSNQLIGIIADRCDREFPSSTYWFPSPAKLGEPIRSIDHVWRNTLHDHRLRFISPRLFRAAFQAQRYPKAFWEPAERLFVPRPGKRDEALDFLFADHLATKE